jgi:hypothetical protein
LILHPRHKDVNIFASEKQFNLFKKEVRNTDKTLLVSEYFNKLTLGQKISFLHRLDYHIFDLIFKHNKKERISKKKFLAILDKIRRIRNFLAHNS